jgi:ribosomal protein S18 acetylase RimI-like enzyme
MTTNRPNWLIERVESATDNQRLDASRHLFKAYADSLPFALEFQDFDEELAGLPGAYAEPSGCILLARAETVDAYSGCVALRPLEPGICEMKRLYILQSARGHGLGRLLAKAILAKGKEKGYTHMRLDTDGSMTAAIALYRSLGFVPIAPYCYNPLPSAQYYECKL